MSLPQRLTISLGACVSGPTASRASTSASMTVAPRSASILATSDFPLAMFPVSPMRIIYRVIEGQLSPNVRANIGSSSQRVTHKLLLVFLNRFNSSEKRDLGGISCRHRMAHTTPRLVRLSTTHHDLGRVVGRRL